MKRCPDCDEELVEIVYGLPTIEDIKQADNKEIFLGGCENGSQKPEYHCYICNKSFYKNLKECN